ncbi:MAG: TetR/AcrR family transcriptional regulator [Caldilineaceae bacterium]|nr:TetR/AcrR family transcriptional regulator [Caldilineaceae bacterium]
MTQPRKSKRRYNSTRRKAQARETRLRIVEAARKLFAERGYTGATIEAIAQESEVAPETIYAVFGNKRAILARLIDISVGGDDEPIPLLERPGPQAVLQEQDPRQQLHRFAQDISAILERVAPIFETMRPAAKIEPDIDDLLQNLLRERLRNMEIFVQHLSEHGPLREGLTETQAAETVWALSSPELFQLLTVARKWTREQYSQWLADTLIRLLLR